MAKLLVSIGSKVSRCRLCDSSFPFHIQEQMAACRLRDLHRRRHVRVFPFLGWG